MASRLETLAPEIAEALSRATTARQDSAALVAARWAVAQVGLDHPSIVRALAGEPVSDLDPVIEVLEQQYLSLYEAAETQSASASGAAWQQAFQRARAASALSLANTHEPAEAIYEAAHSASNIGELVELVMRELQRS